MIDKLWQRDPKRPLGEQVALAANAYARSFGKPAGRALVHPTVIATATGDSPIPLQPDAHTPPGHIFVTGGAE